MFDVVLKSITEICESSRAYDVSTVDNDVGDPITLSMIEGRDNYDKVDVQCKALLDKEPAATGVNQGCTKQEIGQKLQESRCGKRTSEG